MGSSEPNTELDATSGRMFSNPDTTPASGGVRKVYFNAFASEQPAALNPNSGALRSRMELEPSLHYNAFFGVWKDCNADGYVGLGDNALLEYRADLLQDTRICPRDQNSGTFNDGTWVREFLMLAQPDPCVWETPLRAECPGGSSFRKDSRVLYVNDTAVWGDAGKPAEAPSSKDCGLRPLPRGTTSGSGALIGYADCYAGQMLVRKFNSADATLDPTNQQKLYFEDPSSPQSSASRLNVQFPVNLYGNPTTGKVGLLQQDSNDPAFTMWDCTRNTDPEYDRLQADPTHPTPTRTLNPQVRDRTGSYWDAAVAFEEAVQGDCDPSTNNTLRANYATLQLEGPAPADASPLRSRTNVVFVYTDPGEGTGSSIVDASLGLGTTPRDFGVGAARNATGPIWTATASYVARGPLLVRANAGAPLRGATYQTFYARVGSYDISRLGLTLPNIDPATYGQGACGAGIGVGLPPANGWVCDPTQWWRANDGSDVRPYYVGGGLGGPRPIGQVVGAYYQFLDVDCVDGRVLVLPGAPGDGVYSSAAPYSPEGTCV